MACLYQVEIPHGYPCLQVKKETDTTSYNVSLVQLCLPVMAAAGVSIIVEDAYESRPAMSSCGLVL